MRNKHPEVVRAGTGFLSPFLETLSLVCWQLAGPKDGRVPNEMILTPEPKGLISQKSDPSIGEIVTDDPVGETVRHFAIIGTQTPDEAQAQVAFLASWLIVTFGKHVVRMGGDYGISQKVMEGTRGRNLEVYLPWLDYNRAINPRHCTTVVYDPEIHIQWNESIKRFDPDYLTISVRRSALFAREFGLIHGCSGVLAFPGNGNEAKRGIRIARSLNIPLVIGNKREIDDVPRFLGKALQIFGLVDPSLRVTINAL